jgi:queuine/archaeosine tRNA-ribosyltransferase
MEMRIQERAPIPVSGVSLSLPCFFPSISSIKTNLSTEEYLRVLNSTNHPSFLISSYDIHKCKSPQDLEVIQAILKKSVLSGKAVAMDSGNYESYWAKDSTWEEDNFWECLSSSEYSIAFSFDKKIRTLKNGTVATITDEIERSVMRDREHSFKGAIIPIIHAQYEMLPEIASNVALRLRPIMIAIPERELGEGIIKRAITLNKIRKSLNETDQYYPIHLLGTGNPLSILIYVICGADSFDGLEWCQTTVNYENALLFHFQQREFFGIQSKYDSLKIPYTQATLAHNLEFYSTWMKRIENKIRSGDINELTDKYLRKEFTRELAIKISEV